MSDEPRPRVERISAITLFVSDMSRALAFYEALGFGLKHGGYDAGFTTLRAGDGFLNLTLEREPPSPPRWGRVIFYVDDVDAFHARAVQSGLTPDREPSDASWGERYFHIKDPDGHELSFARRLNGR